MRFSRWYLCLIITYILVVSIACNRNQGGAPDVKHAKKVACSATGGCIDCPNYVGKNTCEFSVSDMNSAGTGHLPIYLHHKERILWVGNNGEILTVSDLTGADCQSEQPNNSAPAQPTENLQFNGSDFVFASIKDNKKYDTFCYKQNITYTDTSGSHTIDPHIYIGQ